MKKMFALAMLVVASFTTHTVAQDKQAKNGAAAYDEFPEPWRGRFVSEWKAKVESAKDQLDAVDSQTPRTAKARESQRAQLDASKKQLATLEKNSPRYFRPMPSGISYWNVGDFGRFPGKGAVVYRIVDEVTTLVVASNAHISSDEADALDRDRGVPNYINYPYKGHRWASFQGFSNKGQAKDRQLNLTAIVIVTGKTTFKTASGREETAIVVEPLNLESLKKLDGFLAKQPKSGSGESVSASIQAVKEEIERIKKAIEGDEERLRDAKTNQERRRLEGLLKNYRERLAGEEKKLSDLEMKRDP